MFSKLLGKNQIGTHLTGVHHSGQSVIWPGYCYRVFPSWSSAVSEVRAVHGLTIAVGSHEMILQGAATLPLLGDFQRDANCQNHRY